MREKNIAIPHSSSELHWRPPVKATIIGVTLAFGANMCFPTRRYRWKSVGDYRSLASGEIILLAMRQRSPVLQPYKMVLYFIVDSTREGHMPIDCL